MVKEWLNSLGIDSICQWDVLVFLHRHRAALLGAEHIARLMPYGTGLVVTALDHLESQGLVERSRLSQGARLYELTHVEGPRGRAFQELLALMASRSGRLEIAQNLREAGQHNAVVLKVRVAKAGGNVGRYSQRSALTAGKEGGKWPKAI